MQEFISRPERGKQGGRKKERKENERKREREREMVERYRWRWRRVIHGHEVRPT